MQNYNKHFFKKLVTISFILSGIFLLSCNKYESSKITMYYTDSLPKLKVFYKTINGKEYVAKEIRYYPNNQIQNEAFYNVSYKKEGSWISYFENGKKQRIQNFENNIKNGEYIEFYRNGKKMIQGNFKNGLPSGKWFIWNKKGIKISTTKYKNGKILSQTK